MVRFGSKFVYSVDEKMIFGDQTVYASAQSTEDKIFALRAQMGSTPGLARSITVRLGNNVAGTARCAIYRESTNSLIAVSEEKTVSVGIAWETFNLTTSPILIANEWYYLCVWAPTITIPDYISIVYTETGGEGVYLLALDYTGTFPDPISLGLWGAERSFGIYCTYGLELTELSETQVFEDEEIRDTNAHNSSVGDCSYFNIITIWVENGLDQDVSVQVKGNRVNSTTGAVAIGSAFDVSTVDREARTIEPTDEGFLPFIFIEVTAAGVPTSGNLNAYLIRKPIL